MKQGARMVCLAVSLFAAGCQGPDNGPLEPSLPNPPPAVQLSLAFGEAPVEGEILITPGPGSKGWRYATDLNEDGLIDQQGILGLGIGFRYRFTTAGIHEVHTTLTDPEGRAVEVDSPVIVNDPEAIRVLGSLQVPPVDPAAVSFEGITMNHSGEALYVANYSGGSLHRIDPATLSVTAVIEEMGYSIEGISISPKDGFLFAAYKYHHAASVELAAFDIDRFFERGVSGKFFIQAVDERHALIGGEGSLGLVDMRNGETVKEFRAPGDEFTNTWHFALSPDGMRVAVIVYDSTYALHLADLASLAPLRTLPLGRMAHPRTLAFHPDADRLYVIGYQEDGNALFSVIDLQSGETLREISLGRVFCSGYCVANPAATLRSGQFVAFEWGGGAYFIDTELDLPLYSIPPLRCICGFSVTASPVEDVFYFLGSDGLVKKVAIED